MVKKIGFFTAINPQQLRKQNDFRQWIKAPPTYLNRDKPKTCRTYRIAADVFTCYHNNVMTCSANGFRPIKKMGKKEPVFANKIKDLSHKRSAAVTRQQFAKQGRALYRHCVRHSGKEKPLTAGERRQQIDRYLCTKKE